MKAPNGATVEAGVKMPGGSRRIHATPVPEPQTAVVQLPAEIDATNTGLVETALTSALASRARNGPTRRPSWAECRNRLSGFTL